MVYSASSLTAPSASSSSAPLDRSMTSFGYRQPIYHTQNDSIFMQPYRREDDPAPDYDMQQQQQQFYNEYNALDDVLTPSTNARTSRRHGGRPPPHSYSPLQAPALQTIRRQIPEDVLNDYDARRRSYDPEENARTTPSMEGRTTTGARRVGVPILPPLAGAAGHSAATTTTAATTTPAGLLPIAQGDPLENGAFLRHLQNHQRYDTLRSLRSCLQCPICRDFERQGLVPLPFLEALRGNNSEASGQQQQQQQQQQWRRPALSNALFAPSASATKLEELEEEVEDEEPDEYYIPPVDY